ncbi:two-component regulator propeller domain-containing protein [Tunturiibacter gelidiferens]|uniref:two-component regulator propeller domain-containing protein n=1 Tax=Tunturiibacter gelidiferens TaxID=3069689 RepID=UPI003D9B78D8
MAWRASTALGFDVRSVVVHASVRGNSIFCLEPSSDGGLWIGTEGGGLLHLLNGQVRSLWGDERSDGRLCGLCLRIGKGQWVGTDNGLFKVKGTGWSAWR